MAKKMNDEEMLEAMEQAVKMHFMAFQQFMEADRRRHRPVTATDNQLHGGDA